MESAPLLVDDPSLERLFPEGGFEGFEGLAPSSSGAGFVLEGLVVVIPDFDPEVFLDLVGFGLDDAVDVNVTIEDFDFLAGLADESFDVVFFGIGRVLENDDIPAIRVSELVEIFENKDSIAVTNAPWLGFVGLKRTEWAGGRSDGA